MRLVSYLILFTVLFSACSSTSHKAKVKVERGRVLASETNVQWKQCYLWKKKSCSKRYPYQSINKKWYEFEYKYLNRRNKLHVQFNQCVIDAGIYCSDKFEKLETSKEMQTIKSEQKLSEDLKEISENTIWRNIQIPGINLSSERIKQIFEFVTRTKAIHGQLVEQMSEQGHQIQESSLDALHGFGLSLTGSAFAGLGVEVRHEAVVHEGIMAVFCAPGIEVITDVGIAMELSIVKTLGCKSNGDYKGKFLSMTFGASAETLGLPVTGSVSYSLGVNLTNYLKNLVTLKRNKKFFPKELLHELMSLSRLSNSELTKFAGSPTGAWGVLFVSQFFSKSLEDKETSIELNAKMLEIEEEKIEFDKIESISQLLKLVLQNAMLSPIFRNGSYPQLFMTLRELTKQMSGCDSANLSGGLSLSLAPVSAGFSMHHYYKVTEVDLRDILYLATFGPRTLVSLKLGPTEFERFKKALFNTLKVVPDYLFNKCLEESSQKFYLDGKNIIELLKED
ncbi:MAG: hypothetical protein KC493_03680 [Bacteriovoracaceae bacterium]|nr:hypothetical protein [Bacteriovoracaceae bacterium]